MAKFNLNKESVRLEDIALTYPCPSCEKTFRVFLKKPKQKKLCPKCGKITLSIEVHFVSGKSQVEIVTEVEPTGKFVSPSNFEVEE